MRPIRPILRRTSRSPSTRRSMRTGFTLVELMVAMALSLFLMAILAEAFAVSMDTFRGLRALGDMQDTLRNSSRQLRDDLATSHFEGSRRISDAGFWAEPRREGFFYMKGTQPTSEGQDGNLVGSSRATDHVLHFTIRRPGYRRTSHFGVGPFLSAPFARYTPANNPPDTYYGGSDPNTGGAFIKSQWGEVAYKLFPMAGNPTVPEALPSSSPVKLFNLYRAEALMLPFRDGNNIASVNGTLTLDGQLGQVYVPKISNNLTNFLSPNDVAMSTTRGFNPASNSTTANPTAAQISLLCTNVISFQVRVLVQQRTIGADPSDPNTVKDPVKSVVYLDDMKNYYMATNAADPAIDTAALTTPAWAVPTSSTSTAPAGITPVPPAAAPSQTPGPGLRIMGLQIRLRVYDQATGQTRQNTIVQGL